MGQVRSLDEKLNNEGLLRLTTAERLVKHLGNRLETAGLVDVDLGVRQKAHHGVPQLRNLPLVRRSLLWVYDQIFRLYFSK